MDKIRGWFSRRSDYEPIDEDSTVGGAEEQHDEGRRFSWVEYGIFMLLGVAMLWAWNMFLAAGPYFQSRFSSSKSILSNFQATELSVSTVANLGSMIVLTKMQANASYPRRITSSLTTYAVIFVLLALSTKIFLDISAGFYFGFLIVVILLSSLATGFMQNGTFAYAGSFGRPDYMQAVMTGQAIAGVLPPVAQIILVLSAGQTEGGAGQTTSNAAFGYFLTATGVAGLTLLAFLYLSTHHTSQSQKQRPLVDSISDLNESDEVLARANDLEPIKTTPIMVLASKLRYMAAAVFLTFGITMMFPVFTQAIISVNTDPSPLFRKASYVPLAFLVWNVGDLIGRLIPLIPQVSLAHRPKILLPLSILRLVFIPLYFMCNIQSAEVSVSVPEILSATVKSDLFYLLVVQFPFGLTNGYLGSCCMMGAGACVEESEREASGSFMGLMLVAGLAVGSFCSFVVGNAL